MDLTTALSPEHYEEIIVSSVIDPEVATARGYRTLVGTGADRDELEAIGFARHQVRDDAFPLLLVPMHGMDGEVRGWQIKPAKPRERVKEDGTRVPIKYETPAKAPIVLDVPAFTREALKTPGTPLWVTEGMKKTDALVTKGLAAVGLTGVFNWRNKHGVLGDWEEIPIKDRPVVLCFDADAASNRNVQLAMSRAGAWFRTRGASKVHYVVVPGQVEGNEVKGVDDYFAAGGDVDGLHAAATGTAPGQGEKDAAFTDAFLVEDLAEAMQGRYCWAAGLGWLRWTGRVWKEVSDVEPLEAVRVWASEQFDKVLGEQRGEPSKNLSGQIAGWRAILGKGRLTALRDLAKGLLQRDSEEFDGDPDLLTVLNGTLHLPSGRLLAFDPEHCITKSADAEYRPGARHPSWAAALQAVPAELHEWYQDRLGQALTGYPTPDHTLVIACGTGSNGKSTVADVVRKTMGGYGVMISDRVLMANPDAHPTELMDLRGARYAVMEETPEARHLNVQRLKTTIGTPTIRARRIRMDTVEFITTHSLFINTNYRPVVTETDWGTWRRLALQTFPFTFKKPGQPLDGPWERVGDPTLAYASNDPEVRTAALAWMAEGARAWYARGRMMLAHPERVENQTREWRSETDLILGFSDECLRFTPEGFTQTQDMLKAFNDWAGERGHRPWNDRTFASRFGSHDVVRGAKVQQGRFSVGGKQQRGWSGVEINKDGRDPFTGQREEPPAPEPDPVTPEEHEAAARYQAMLDYPPLETPAPDHDASCLADPDGPEGPDRPEPAVLGFDLETADAEKLFTGGHEGPFVRLLGAVDNTGEPTSSRNPERFVRLHLDNADVIYGHNILGFDLLALAHHHGADYDALAAKAVDTQVLAKLIDPPLSKGMPNGYYGLDQVAQRLGHEGKTDDLKALAKRYGGYDRIPVDDAEYNSYLRGDLAASKHVYEGLRMLRMGDEGSSPSNATIAYAEREMRIVALQNRMTLNGWAVDCDLLAGRVEAEADKRGEAIAELHGRYGVPLAKPDRFKLKPKREWPEELTGMSVTGAREWLADNPQYAVAQGIAVRIPGEVYASPWATDAGREAIERAFHDAGAKYLPRTKSGQMAMSSDALGEERWFDAHQAKSVPGLLQVYGDKPEVRALTETLLMATGARAKYAEVAKSLTPAGRVHGFIGAAQGSGRWAQSPFTTMGSRGAAAAERDVMVADEGHMLITCDLSQVDLRAMAGLSQDPAYMEILQPGRDAHSEMAKIYFGELTPDTRQKTKAFNHAGNYGQGPKAVSERTGIPLEKCYEIRDAKIESYPRLAEYIEEVRELAASGQLLDNGFGRLMRPDPERAYTQGPALMGQGAARDIMCESLLRLVALADETGRNVRPYLRAVVHDEVVLSVPEHEVSGWSMLLAEAFTWVWRGVPILCEVSNPAKRWSECAH